MPSKHQQVTVFYFDDNDLQLKHHIGNYRCSDSGRVVLPNAFKEDKQVIAVCEGKVDILNKIGDRLTSAHFFPSDSIQALSY
ncbi:TIGR02922 family protein [Thalassotalea euphylliae]|uniref:TIGR02922 family protein n=1 Tax=Thalassotalea euphylliae TaxID=1655234 RepID=UPI00363CB92A